MQFVEEEFQIRNKDLHKQHCDYLDHPGMSESEKDHYSKVYGVNRTSILCQVPHFNVTEQLPQDLMHVLLEGVFHIHVNELLKYLVDTLSFMTLAEINHRIMSHPYAYFEEKPAPLRNLDPHGNQSGIIAHNQVPFLRGQIQQYLEQFISLYPHRPLTPKFHFMVHLPNLINRYKT